MLHPAHGVASIMSATTARTTKPAASGSWPRATRWGSRLLRQRPLPLFPDQRASRNLFGVDQSGSTNQGRARRLQGSCQSLGCEGTLPARTGGLTTFQRKFRAAFEWSARAGSLVCAAHARLGRNSADLMSRSDACCSLSSGPCSVAREELEMRTLSPMRCAGRRPRSGWGRAELACDRRHTTW